MATSRSEGERTTNGWLAAVALVATAESAALADIAVQNTVALAASHAACELLLSLVAESGTRSAPKNEHFPALIARAMERANAIKKNSFSVELEDQLRRLNGIRNSALHEGVAVASSSASEACATARDLLALVPVWVNRRLSVARSGGLASAVAAIVDVHDIAEGLQAAEDHLAKGRLRASVETTEEVLDLVLLRAGLPTAIPPGGRGAYFSIPQTDLRARMLYDAAKASARDERWVLRLAIGSRVRDLKRLTWITTSMRRPGDPSREDAAWALSRVAEMTARLAMSGALDLAWQDFDGDLPQWEQRKGSS